MYAASAPQEAAAATVAPAAAGGGFGRWLLDLVGQPGVLEFLLALVVLSAVLLFWWRLAALVRGARSRQVLADYLLGVEQALHGDLDGAHTRLGSVVQLDPENHYARLLLGKVLAERGDPERAHQQHVCLKSAFGLDTVENDLMLAQSLLGAGLPREAAEAAERALQQNDRRAAGWDFVYRARLQAGDFAAAAVAGRRLLQLVDDGERRGLRADVARTLAQAGQGLLARGDAVGAGRLLADAERLDAAVDAVPLLAARLQAQQRGVPATVQALLAAAPDASTGPQLPALAVSTRALATTHGLPMAPLHGLVAPSRWTCRACGAPLDHAVTECARCRATAPAELAEPLLVHELRSPGSTMDAIDVNDAHVQRLVQALLGHDLDARRQARAELLELRERAVPTLLRAAWHLGANAQDQAIDVLRSMGPTIAPVLFTASDDLTDERLLPLGSRSPAHLVGRVVQGFDRSALPHVEPLFASAKAEHRKILIDFFLGLADLEQFQLVLERFPPMEILHRLNKAEAPVLRRFLQVVPRGHFLAESLLLEPTFDRDAEVLAAIPGAREPLVLTAVLLRRGASRTLLKVLLGALADGALADTAEPVLQQLGAGALEYVLSAFTDPERPGPERMRLARLLVHGGAAAAEHVADSFGPEPSGLDDELRGILAGIGDPAVPVLQAAYGHSGWLEKVSIGLISRHTNRRVQIVHALRAIGTPLASAALQQLADGERDANLRLRLQQALHDTPPAEGAR